MSECQYFCTDFWEKIAESFKSKICVFFTEGNIMSIVKQEAKKGNRIDSKSAYLQYLQGQKPGLIKGIVAVINN